MSTESAKILLIEDDDSHAEIIRRCFHRLAPDAILEQIDDGEQALQCLLDLHHTNNQPGYDLIILDQRLPKWSGLEILQVLVDRNATPDVPLVIFSTSDTEEDRREAMRLGASDYIAKPTELGEFLAAVGRLNQYLLGEKAPSS